MQRWPTRPDKQSVQARRFWTLNLSLAASQYPEENSKLSTLKTSVKIIKACKQVYLSVLYRARYWCHVSMKTTLSAEAITPEEKKKATRNMLSLPFSTQTPSGFVHHHLPGSTIADQPSTSRWCSVKEDKGILIQKYMQGNKIYSIGKSAHNKEFLLNNNKGTYLYCPEVTWQQKDYWNHAGDEASA